MDPEPLLGEVRLMATTFAPQGWADCDGRLLAVAEHSALFQVIGTRYGGDGIATFALPDLRGRVPVHPDASLPLGSVTGSASHTLTVDEMPAHTHRPRAGGAATASDPAGARWAATDRPHYAAGAQVAMAPGAVEPAGAGVPFSNMPPYTAVRYVIALQGVFPTDSGSTTTGENLVAELKIFAGGFAPSGWAVCDGSLLPIGQNQALFSLVGNAYGGNGTTTFALPDLRGATPVHVGQSWGGSVYTRGQRGGAAEVALTATQLPPHVHAVRAAAPSARGTTGNPSGGTWAIAQQGRAREALYTTGAAETTMSADALAPAGGGRPRPNRPPTLALTMLIALWGTYPTRS